MSIEMTQAQQEAFFASVADDVGETGVGEAIDAKDTLAKALVLNGAPIPDAAARVVEYLHWSLGPARASRIVKRQLALRLRQNVGFSGRLVDAIKALATIENREASLFGAMGKGGDK